MYHIHGSHEAALVQNKRMNRLKDHTWFISLFITKTYRSKIYVDPVPSTNICIFHLHFYLNADKMFNPFIKSVLNENFKFKPTRIPMFGVLNIKYTIADKNYRTYYKTAEFYHKYYLIPMTIDRRRKCCFT